MDPLQCKACGSDHFVQGRMGNGATSVKPIDKLSGGSFIMLTFCSECGEVSSIKVENPSKFK
ncbi:hypothetical protein [Oceanobacillus manasiensis]|uniref:hypothetical protein n=1 Tax=Oceanobacillus manasiensis TaxID=586413 RepID=UPI0005AABF22|nr:hypothetical protein [Oceanobacillus manasiensis]